MPKQPYRLTHIEPVKPAAIIGIMYALISIILLVPFFLLTSTTGLPLEDGPFGFLGGAFFFLLPVIYGVIAFLSTVIFIAIFNLVNKWVGGVEVIFETPSAKTEKIPPSEDE